MNNDELEKLKDCMEFCQKYPIIYRLWLWWHRPLLCKLDLHLFSWEEWGKSCTGKIDFFCARCQKKIKSVAMDDIPIEIRNNIINIARQGLSKE